ncbi:MAG: D-tyrosyl-tRNA(Tyr) deacylase [Phycisphaeraceae bacterium]|nr:D-tyrosyl-tRNA(Tyr) deacylase [Phycisphaerales bacterium]MCB9842878.1 D-tyrosyl-tRNA(Tyr) deacylase [Phycisphaeraceae bacterium]
MRCVVQRVLEASVRVDGKIVGAIARGLLVLAAVEKGDTRKERAWMAEKLANLRLFPDGDGKMNLSVLDLGADGGILMVPNFTVAGDCKKGRRPGFDGAMRPPEAETEFGALCDAVGAQGVRVARGVFGADMKVAIVNDGPVTVVVESPSVG